jgi:hypothetical protein
MVSVMGKREEQGSGGTAVPPHSRSVTAGPLTATGPVPFPSQSIDTLAIDFYDEQEIGIVFARLFLFCVFHQPANDSLDRAE